MLKTTISGLVARKLRLFATAFAVLLGVAFMAGTFVLTDTIQRTFHDLFGSVYVHTDAVVRGPAARGTSGFEAQRPPVDEAVVRTVAGVPGVRAAEGNVMGYAQLVDEQGKAVGTAQYAYGLNWNQVAQLNPFNLVAGRAPRAGADVVTGKAIVKESDRDIKKAVKGLNRGLLAFALIALFVGSFIIYNTFSILVAQRGREMALLRAIGASRRQVLGSVLLEAVVVGLIAALLGVAAGIGVAAGLRALLSGFGLEIPAGGIVLTPRTVLVSLLTGVLV